MQRLLILNILKKDIFESNRDRDSKFIGHLFPIDSREAFKKQPDGLKSGYSNATHHCYAWRIDPENITECARDGGEPAGTT